MTAALTPAVAADCGSFSQRISELEGTAAVLLMASRSGGETCCPEQTGSTCESLDHQVKTCLWLRPPLMSWKASDRCKGDCSHGTDCQLRDDRMGGLDGGMPHVHSSAASVEEVEVEAEEARR